MCRGSNRSPQPLTSASMRWEAVSSRHVPTRYFHELLAGRTYDIWHYMGGGRRGGLLGVHTSFVESRNTPSFFLPFSQKNLHAKCAARLSRGFVCTERISKWTLSSFLKPFSIYCPVRCNFSPAQWSLQQSVKYSMAVHGSLLLMIKTVAVGCRRLH